VSIKLIASVPGRGSCHSQFVTASWIGPGCFRPEAEYSRAGMFV
jgi:hypothetical protein